MGADVHARENDGLPRVEYLLKKGTNVLRERAARTAELERLGGGERTATDVSARVVDPTRFFLDEGSGRPVKPGDSYVRAIKVLRDTELAKDKRVCTFKPRVTKASRAICEARDAADPAARGAVRWACTRAASSSWSAASARRPPRRRRVSRMRRRSVRSARNRRRAYPVSCASSPPRCAAEATHLLLKATKRSKREP